MMMSGLPPGRTGIETCVSGLTSLKRKSQDYPPAGLGLRPLLVHSRDEKLRSGIPPGRTGIDTESCENPYRSTIDTLIATPENLQ